MKIRENQVYWELIAVNLQTCLIMIITDGLILFKKKTLLQ